jgi:murein DD-endopeptidase MepM/ murein hydrolase activator NlpD
MKPFFFRIILPNKFFFLTALVAVFVAQMGVPVYPVRAETPSTPTPEAASPSASATPTTQPTDLAAPTAEPTDIQVPIPIETLVPSKIEPPIPSRPVFTSDEEAIRYELEKAIHGNEEAALAFMLYEVQVDHMQFSQDRNLALVWLAFADPQTKQVLATEPGLAIATRGQKNWQITLQMNVNWSETLEKVPASLLSPGMRAQLLPSPQGGEMSAQAGQVFSGYKLPWKGGTFNYVSGSVGHVLTYKSCVDTCRYAFDFADGSMFPVYAARSGRVKFAAWTYPNGNEQNANYLILEDASTVPTTYQVYYHLAQNSIPPELRVVGTPVNQGQFIALADDTGASTGHHLHFHVHTTANSVWGASVDITFDDVLENGGRPRTCAEAAAFPSYGSECSPGNKLLSSNGSTGVTPPTPAISGPVGTVRTNSPTFQWNAIDGALQYYLWVNKAGSTTASISQLVNASACINGVCSYTSTTSLPDAAYEVKVRAGSSSDWSGFSAISKFTVYTLPPVPELVAPSGRIYINNPAYTWKAVPGATQYYLMVYSDTSASYIIYRTLYPENVCSGNLCAYTSTLNVKHGSYKFEVRAGNAAGVWSAYSAWMPFNAYLAPPAPTNLQEPAANQKLIVARPTYRWQGLPGATKYTLRIYSLTQKAYVGTYDFATIYVCTGDVCWFKPAANLAAGSYQFQVRAYDSNGYGDYSVAQPFTVQLVPDPPTLTVPNGTINTLKPAYTWKPVANATAYYLMVWSNAEAKYIIYRTLYPSAVCSSSTCSYTSSLDVVKGRSYWFWVQSYNSYGWGAYSPKMNFKVAQ